MYNLSIAQSHTFLVGKGGWIVHNIDCGESEIYDASQKPINNQGQTRASQALQSHAERLNPQKYQQFKIWNGDKVAQYNAKSAELVQDILTDPNNTWKYEVNTSYGPMIEVRGGQFGLGLRYSLDGLIGSIKSFPADTFIGFIN